MGFLDRFKRAKNRPERQGTGLEIARWNAAPPRRGSRELLAAYKEMPWLRTIVDTVADSVAGASWRVYRPVAGKGKAIAGFRNAPPSVRRQRMKALFEIGSVEEVPDHPLLALLDDPNDHFTAPQMWALVQKYLDLLGEAFVVVEKREGIPVSLWPMPPHLVTRLPDMSHPRERRTYTVTIGAMVRDIPADCVMHLRDLDPDDPLGRGVGRAFALGDELDTDEYAARFLKNYFFNSAVPAAIASIEGATEGNPAIKRFKEEMAREHSGPNNAGKLLLTNGKVSLARLDSKLVDMDIVALRKSLMDFVRMTYRVPPEIVGDITGSNKASAYAARENLAEQATVPRLEFLRTQLQKWLMPCFGGGAFLDYDSPVPADAEFQLRTMGTLPEAYSYDEWRALAGFKPDPNRQGYPLPLPGQQQGGQQTPDAEEGGAAEAAEEAKGDPPWSRQPLR